MIKDNLIKVYTTFKSGHGFKPVEPKEEEWLFGSIGDEVVREDGNWNAFLPPYEKQKLRGLETMNCTCYGTLNQIEIYLKAKYDLDVNFSERYCGILAGTTPNGNNPQKVYEAIRKNGLLLDMMMPFDDSIDTWTKYYSPKPIDKETLEVGVEWLKNWDFKHEWVSTPRNPATPDQLKQALKYSPLAIGVYAWAQNKKGNFIKYGRDNHWTVCPNWQTLANIYDSYPPFEKNLEQGTPVTWAKRISIEKLDKPRKVEIKFQIDKSFLEQLRTLLKKFNVNI